MNTVAHPLSDGSQPAGEAQSSRRTLLAAPVKPLQCEINKIDRGYEPHPCPKCGGERFWRKGGFRKSGRAQFHATCPPCHREYLAKMREKDGGAAKQNKSWESRNPLKARAHRTVETHLKNGNIVRKPCERCGAGNAQAHHEDYSHALEITWLCPPHHAERHREMRAEALGAAPFPTPQASSSQASAGTSAMSAVTRVPPLSLHEDPCLSAQLAMGIR